VPWAEVEVGLPIPAQAAALSVDELNRMFYGKYPRGFFKAALQLAAAAYHDPVGALSPFSELTTLKGEEGEGALQIQVTVDDDDSLAFREAARLQMANLYYHALETFVRLFLAHAPGVDCPWMQLVRDEGPPFVKKLKQLEKISNRWESSDTPEDEHVRVAFFPVRDPEPDIRTAFGHAKSWLRFAAQECRQARVNNAFKHGISVRAGEPVFALYSGTDPRTDAESRPVMEWSGEALITLARVRQPDRSWDWLMEHQKLSVTSSIGIVYLIQRWIQAILDVGELRFLGQQSTNRVDLPNVSFEDFVERIRVSSSPMWSMTSLRMPTGWADLPPARGTSRKGKKRKQRRNS
jgi:hypothetical protein